MDAIWCIICFIIILIVLCIIGFIISFPMMILISIISVKSFIKTSLNVKRETMYEYEFVANTNDNKIIRKSLGYFYNKNQAESIVYNMNNVKIDEFHYPINSLNFWRINETNNTVEALYTMYELDYGLSLKSIEYNNKNVNENYEKATFLKNNRKERCKEMYDVFMCFFKSSYISI